MCIVIGFGTLKLLNRFFSVQTASGPSPEFIWVTGLAVLSIILSWVSILFPIGIAVHLAVLLSTLLIFFLCYRSLADSMKEWFSWYSKMPAMLKVMLALIVLFVIDKTSLTPMVFDTALYHLQTMNWIESYSVVPGLGNLHDRLAFNSSWFICATFFRFSWLHPDGYYVLNGLLFTIGVLLGFRGLTALYNREIRLKWTISLLFLMSYLIYIKQISSPSPDMPVTLLIWMVFMLYMARDNVEKNISLSDILCMLLPVVIITFKFSALLIILLPLYLMIRYLRIRKTGFVLKIILLMALIISPWIIRSVILSGYAVFPNTTLDLFNVDWKIPKEIAQRTADAVFAWGRIPGGEYHSVLQLPFSKWVPAWYKLLFIFDKLILILFLSCVLVWTAMLLFRFSLLREYFSRNSRHLVILSICMAGIIFWFATAPDFRFAYGFLLLALVILTYPLLKYIAEKLFRFTLYPALLVGSLLGFLILSESLCRLMLVQPPVLSRMVYPAAPQDGKIRSSELDGHVIYYPENDYRCWNTPVPCAPEPTPGLKMRGNKIENGFKIQAE